MIERVARVAVWGLVLLSLCVYVIQPVAVAPKAYAHEEDGGESPEEEAAERRETFLPPSSRALLPEEKRFCRKNTKLVQALMSRQVDRSSKEYAVLTDMNKQLAAYRQHAGLASPELDRLEAQTKKQQQLADSAIRTLKTIPAFVCTGGKIQAQIIDYTDNLDNVIVAIRAYAAQTKDYVQALKQASATQVSGEAQ